MPTVNKPYTFNNGQTADATQVDQNFDVLYNAVNGNLDSTNLAANAVQTTNVATEAVTPVKTEGIPYAIDTFGNSFIVSGLTVTKDGTNLNQVDVTAGVVYIQQADGSLRRFAPAATNFRTASASATYYLDFNPDGTWSWTTGHSTQSNYLNIATVTSDASSNVSTVTQNNNSYQSSVSAANLVVGGTKYTGSQSATASTVAVRDTNGNVAQTMPTSTGQNPNLLFNPSFRFGTSGWTGIGSNGYSAVFGSNGEGGFLTNTTSASGTQVTSAKISIGANQQFTVSGEMNASGVTAGSINLLMYAFDSNSNSLGQIGAAITATNGQSWTKYQATFTTPANTASIQVYCYMSTGITNTNAGWRKIKVEPGSYVTTFSDDNSLNTVQYGSVIPFVQKHSQARVDLLRGNYTGTSTTNQAVVAGTAGSITFTFHASEWTSSTFYAEMMVGMTSSLTGYFGIFDNTAGAIVSGSEVSTSASSAYIRSSSFTLIDGHTYTIYYRVTGGTASIWAVDLLQLI